MLLRNLCSANDFRLMLLVDLGDVQAVNSAYFEFPIEMKSKAVKADHFSFNESIRTQILDCETLLWVTCHALFGCCELDRKFQKVAVQKGEGWVGCKKSFQLRNYGSVEGEGTNAVRHTKAPPGYAPDLSVTIQWKAENKIILCCGKHQRHLNSVFYLSQKSCSLYCTVVFSSILRIMTH